MNLFSLLNFVLALVSAPLLLGVINKTKAFFAGRQGQPLLQAYYDLWKLLQKSSVYSRTTSWIFRAGPVVGLACAVLGAAIVPFGGTPGIFAFPCDLILLAYLFGLMRFFTVLAALDTGSSFEGMGASREVHFSALAEPALVLGLGAISRLTGQYSLSDMFNALSVSGYAEAGPVGVLVVSALLIVLLAENARIPFDDPNTHLELTMIHEVMVLDHSGPDFAFILYGAALKFWILGSLLIHVAVPIHTSEPALDIPVAAAAMIGLAVLVGGIESTMARLRLVRVPRLLVGAVVLSGLAFVLLLR